MNTNLILHELTGSPNSVKARIALGYKGLKYDRKPVELSDFPGNRDSVVKLSRQPRLPVLQHGQTVIFDSGAILLRVGSARKVSARSRRPSRPPPSTRELRSRYQRDR